MQTGRADTEWALRGARVLIVEDDVLLIMELESILRAAGAEIAGCCRTVKEGLAAVERNAAAVAILDVRLGHDTIAPVARLLTSRGTPFIFYTGQVENDPALVEWTGHTVLSKPTRPAAIVAALAGALGRTRAVYPDDRRKLTRSFSPSDTPPISAPR
jgi:DNA-binding response OmpR family regulator